MKYDKIIVGSSPACLVDALFDKKQDSTLIVDDAADLGGAWKLLPEDGSGIAEVETGCHIIEKDRKVFRFLQKSVGLTLVKLEPQPKITYGKKWLPYNLKNLLFLPKDIKLYFQKKYGWSHFKMNTYLFLKELFSLRLAYYSFQKDSTELTHRLGNLLTEKNIEAKLNTRISKVEVDTANNKIILVTNKGEIMNTHKLVFTYTSSFDQLLIDGNDHTSIFDNDKQTFVHVHLVLKAKQLTPFTYLRLYKNPLVHRISNMSKQVNLKPNEHLICIGIFAHAYNSSSHTEIRIKVLQLLNDLNLTPNGCEVVKERWSTYQMATTDINKLKKLNTISHGLINVIYTPDLTLSLVERIKELNLI